MSYIHFKSVYNKNYDKVTFDSPSLTLSQLKKLIIEKSKFKQTKQLDFDLEITNADTNEVYRNENENIMKNSRVHVKRIMKSATMPLRAQPTKPIQPATVASTAAAEAAASFALNQMKSQPQYTPSTIPKSTAPTPVLTSEVPIIKPPISTSTSSLQQNASIQIGQGITSLSQSVSASNLTNSSLSKSAYDSLAPLNLPSKPIYYQESNGQQKSTELELSQINMMQATQSTTKTEDSRQDEKAKLESILLSSMNSQSQMASSGGVKSSQYSTNNTMMQQHLTSQNLDTGSQNVMSAQAVLQQQNRFTGSQWPPRMPLGQHRPLPATYRCTICKKPGHPKNMCPDAGSYVKPEERPKFPSGIPKGKMIPAEAGDKFALLGPDGYVVPIIEYQVSQVVKKDKPAFLTEEEEEEEKKRLGYDPNAASIEVAANKYPPELKCPFGDHIIKDAVLVPCCGHFICCDECIREKISKDECVECPHEDCDQEIGSLESITPYHNIRRMVNDYLSEVKLANQRTVKESSQAKTTVTSDPFLESLLDDVDVKFKETDKSPKLEYDDLLAPKIELKDEKFDSDQASGVQSPVQDSKISSSVAQLQASLAQNLLKKSDEKSSTNMSPIQQQTALLPTPPLTINENKGTILPTKDFKGTPPASASPPVNISNVSGNRSFEPVNKQFIGPMTQPQQQQQFPARMINQPQNFGNYPQVRPQNVIPSGPNVPMQPHFQKPPMNPQRPMMMPQQNYPPNQQMPFMGPNQMMNQNMMARPMGPGFNQPQSMQFQMQKSQYPMNQFPMQQQQPFMGPQSQQGFGLTGPSQNMPPYMGPSGSIPPMSNISQNQLYNQQNQAQKLHNQPITKPVVMTEAEFYSYKERLKREAEQRVQSSSTTYRGSKYRRSRSRSYTSTSRSYSGSRSRSRSHKRRNRSRNRSYSYSRSRSRSSSRSDRRYKTSKSKRYSKSRSRSPGYHSRYSKTSQSSQNQKSSYRGSSMSKSSSTLDKYYRSSNYRRKSRSSSRSRSSAAIKTNDSQEHIQSKRYQKPVDAPKKSRSKTPSKSRHSRSRSNSQSRRKLTRKNENKSESSQKNEKVDNREVSPDNRRSKSGKKETILTSEPKPQKENNYDQAVHKIMNKIRRSDKESGNSENKKIIEDDTIGSDKDNKDKSEKKIKKDKEKSKHRDKRIDKSEKDSAKDQPKGEKRQMPTIEETNADDSEVSKKDDGIDGSDRETKKKKHKKGDKSERDNSQEKDSKEKHKKHKKSKKHKHKHKSVSKERDSLVEAQQQQPAQVAAY